MTWALQTGNNNFDVSGTASSVSTTTGAVSAGDTMNVAVTFATDQGATGGEVTDNLGNTYAVQAAVTDGAQSQRTETWRAKVTTGGTPTVRLRLTPTPGTTKAGNLTIVADPFTGSDSSSAIDGTPKAQVQIAPGTGTDAVTSGTMTTATNGSLVYAATVDTSTGANPGAAGTGFTTAQLSNASGVVIRTEYKVQSTAGSVAGTFTATGGGDNFTTAAHAVTPAGGGGVTPALLSRAAMPLGTRAGSRQPRM